MVSMVMLIMVYNSNEITVFCKLAFFFSANNLHKGYFTYCLQFVYART